MQLCVQAQEGDGHALERLVRMYRPLMIRLARRWAVCGFDDALQEAHVALLEAVRRYDASYGVYFGAYVRRRIRARLRTWGRREMRWPERHVAASADETDEGDRQPVETWADERPSHSRLWWEAWMQGLSPRERFVIERQFIDGYGLWEIAEQEAVSRHTVHTWKKRAMKKLRQKAGRGG